MFRAFNTFSRIEVLLAAFGLIVRILLFAFYLYIIETAPIFDEANPHSHTTDLQMFALLSVPYSLMLLVTILHAKRKPFATLAVYFFCIMYAIIGVFATLASWVFLPIGLLLYIIIFVGNPIFILIAAILNDATATDPPEPEFIYKKTAEQPQ